MDFKEYRAQGSVEARPVTQDGVAGYEVKGSQEGVVRFVEKGAFDAIYEVVAEAASEESQPQSTGIEPGQESQPAAEDEETR